MRMSWELQDVYKEPRGETAVHVIRFSSREGPTPAEVDLHSASRRWQHISVRLALRKAAAITA